MRATIAARISQAFDAHALHDSRFGRDFSQFIPGFDGHEQAAERLAAERCYRKARYIFATPDNALQPLRLRALLDGMTLVLPSYGLHRGFLLLEPKAVPAGQEQFASWLDGVDQFAREVSLEELQERGPFEMIVAGASAVTTQGLRFGMGHHYLDVEWAMFSELALVRPDLPVAVLIHETQLCEEALAFDPTEVRANLIVTPTRTLRVDVGPRPVSLDRAAVDELLKLRRPPRAPARSSSGS